MRIIRFEIYRAFHSHTFLLSILIGFIICALDLISFCIMFGVNGAKQMYLIQSWIGTDYQFAYNQMFYIFLPVIACLPYGGSQFTDIRSGYDKNILTKVSRTDYTIAKCIAVFLSAFVGVVFPLGLNLFVSAGLFPDYIPERLEWMSVGLLDRNLFVELTYTHPVFYCLVYILIDGFFAGAIALTSISIARGVKSFFTAVVTPAVILLVMSIFLEGNEYGNWSVSEMLNPVQNVVTLWWQMFIAFVFILVLNVIVSLITTRKRDVL